MIFRFNKLLLEYPLILRIAFSDFLKYPLITVTTNVAITAIKAIIIVIEFDCSLVVLLILNISLTDSNSPIAVIPSLLNSLTIGIMSSISLTLIVNDKSLILPLTCSLIFFATSNP